MRTKKSGSDRLTIAEEIQLLRKSLPNYKEPTEEEERINDSSPILLKIKLQMERKTNHHNVYVVKLSKEVLQDRRFLNKNPGIDNDLQCYYVGMTGLTPEERFQNHKNGYKSSRIAKKYGECLVPRLYKKYNPMSYKQATVKEVNLASELRLKGHGVWQE